MDMFGGLTKTSSRIAIAAAFGLTLGGYALSSGPALAADFGGDCCADLEERVAELEATTVRKGNKKVSVTLSGWVVKTMNYWDDGDIDHFVVGDKDADLSSRFAITGSATIAPGWSGGYNLTVVSDGDIFGIGSNQEQDLTGGGVDIRTLYSYIYIKSDNLGTLNWGTLSPASDNPAVLADISGTVIESNGVFFEGPGFFLRPKGAIAGGDAGLAGTAWGAFLFCQGLGAGIGVDCFGGPQSAVRYDSPTWGGFRFETSYGENQGLAGVLGDGFSAEDQDFWDIAVFYNNDWGNFKVSAAYAYTWIETAAVSVFNPGPFGQGNSDLHQVGATVMHTPSGLGIYGMYQHESTGGRTTDFSNFNFNTLTFGTTGFPDTDAWYLKPFIKRTWNPAGATVFYGEYGQYNDMFGGLAGNSLCGSMGLPGTNIGAFCGGGGFFDFRTVTVTGSEVERWGLGVVQEIDSAAMHVFARWQHQDISVNFIGTNTNVLTQQTGTQRVGQGFDDWDLFQVGGVIFF
ncbi:MAG: hypothetical protein WD852_07760 [Methyloceanibacter sp.]